jgi:hypothetical protein
MWMAGMNPAMTTILSRIVIDANPFRREVDRPSLFAADRLKTEDGWRGGRRWTA